MPKVSVIIPVYGVEKYIERCARSLFEQTLDDIEYIFIDDCTPDNSIQILNNVLKQYAHRQKQTQIVRMPVNSGLPAVRKYGIQLATGEYILHCDSDDWLDIHAYEKMYNKAIEGDYDIVFCDLYDSDGINHLHIKNNFGDITTEDMLYSVVCRGFQWSLCGSICKRSIFKDNNIVYPNYNNGEDFALMVQMVYYAKRFFHIKEPLYYYFQNIHSISKGQSIENYKKRLTHHQNNVELVTHFFERENVLDKYQDVVISLKLYGKAILAPISYDKEYRKLWYNTFPELNGINILFRKRISFILKMKYWGVKTHTYFMLRLLRRVKWKFVGRSQY